MADKLTGNPFGFATFRKYGIDHMVRFKTEENDLALPSILWNI